VRDNHIPALAKDAGFLRTMQEAINGGFVDDVFWDKKYQAFIKDYLKFPLPVLEMIKRVHPRIVKMLGLHLDPEAMHMTWPQKKGYWEGEAAKMAEEGDVE
jgi:hypothetical protein